MRKKFTCLKIQFKSENQHGANNTQLIIEFN